jgi:hypothetical protein
MTKLTASNLLAIAASKARQTPGEVLDSLTDPNWALIVGTNRWHRFVADDIVDEWPNLSQESRLVALISAQSCLDIVGLADAY